MTQLELIVIYHICSKSSFHCQNPREDEANIAGNHLLDKPNMPVMQWPA